MKNLVLSCLESRVENNRSLYGRFLLAPFQNGNALTMGTALRRALLSQIEGIAITALDIQGITHEFSTIIGVRESVLELSLNFQRIILRDNIKLKKVQVGYLQVQGPAVVYANDLKLPRGLECVDPTQYIATLSRDGLLVVKFLIETSTQKSNLKKNNSLLTAYQIQKAKQVLKDTKVIPVLSNQWSTKETKMKNDFKDLSNGVEELLTLENVPDKSEETKDGSLNSISKTGTLQNLQTRRILPNQTSNSKSEVENDELLNFVSITNKVVKKDSVLTNENLSNFVSTNNSSLNFVSKKCLQNIIPLDAFVAPVNKANFVIQTDDLSVGARERLVLEIWTNGSINPRQAINSAVLSLITLFSEFRNLIHLDSHSLEIKNGLQSELQMNLSKRLSFLYKSHLDKTSLFSSDLSNLSLSLKTYIFLKQKGINKLETLLNSSSRSLLQLVNGNKNMFYEIKRCLFVLGLQLKDGSHFYSQSK